MEAYGQLSDKQKKDLRLFKKVQKILRQHGFRELSERGLRKIYTRINVKPPKVERTKGLLKKISFIFEINRLIISVHTTFNREQCQFTKGAFSIIVEDPFLTLKRKNKKVFFRQCNKGDSLPIRMDAIVSYFMKEFSEERRPQTRTNEWATIRECGQDNYQWVDGKRKIRGLFDKSSPKSLVRKIQKEKEYYEETREQKGIQNRRRKIKKPYRQKRR